MKTRRYTEPQILAILKQAEGGLPVAELCRQRADDLASEPVKKAVARKGRPCRVVDADTFPMFTDT